MKEAVEPPRLSGPVQFVKKLLESWRLEPRNASAMLGLGKDGGTQLQRILCGQEMLSAQEAKERIVHLFHIRGTLWSLFNDISVENEWLREPHSLLGDREPMELLLGGSMEDLLLVREYVETMAGR